MIRNEMHLFQQQHKETLHIHGHSTETTHRNAPVAVNGATTYSRGHQGLQFGQVQLIKTSSNVPGNL